MTERDRNRFYSKVQSNFAKTFEGSCCEEWTAHKTKDGYGQFKYKGKAVHAHRIAWLFASFQLPTYEAPEYLVLDHACKNRACVNIKHLRVVTSEENSLNNSNSGPAKNKQKKNCPTCGGEYTEIIVKKTGRKSRKCKTCRKNNRKRYIILQPSNIPNPTSFVLDFTY